MLPTRLEKRLGVFIKRYPTNSHIKFIYNIFLMEDLVKVSTYAKQHNVSVQAVYTWILDKRIQAVEIDGVKFIKVKNSQDNEN